MISAQDEAYHVCDSRDSLWRESHYFNFCDPRHRIGGITTIGRKPNQGHTEAVLVLYLPDGSLLVHKRETPVSDDIAAGALRYEMTEPLVGWRLTFEGTCLRVTEPRKLASRWTQLKALFRRQRVRLDLRWQGLNPVFDYGDYAVLPPDNRVAARHYEQTGSYTGVIELGGERLDINALGQRDHSWGIRDWHAPDEWRWIVAQFGADFAVHGSRLVLGSAQGELGFVWRDGANHVVRRLELDTEYELDGVTQKRVVIRFHEDGGHATEVTAETITPAVIAFRDKAGLTIITEALSRFTGGDRTGYGITEYLRQVR
jgi:hypothetical protein